MNELKKYLISKKKIVAIISSALTVAILTICTSASSPNPYTIDFSQIVTQDMISGLISTIMSAMTVAIPIFLMILAVGLGIKLFKRFAK